ncbi:hypothetical protein [Candidatus Desulforudis audaxviator]|uniref:Uncharacterized protein n=1 Tax=Desulforudis audaxviator (strain MP104C) TaxID=477974 RepID=B1I464_DESAP|nr:hypothetical protein [Candidatus Desulforudis audaxviator]ACA59685.1 hypothetical protein Daud_1174 [Candidatus Desulforudis audaxviator MP104C]AZK59678.1 hypothetical protein Daudx_1128 [Candidatus Desulforudis audaxviator]
MKVFYVHNTPLAGLFALDRAAAATGGEGKTRTGSLTFLDHQYRFIYTGRDPEDREVYAVWARADQRLLPRLIGTFCDMFDIGQELYAVHRITVPPDSKLRLAAFCYRIGFYGVGRWLLERLESRRLFPSRSISVDGSGELGDNAGSKGGAGIVRGLGCTGSTAGQHRRRVRAGPR